MLSISWYSFQKISCIFDENGSGSTSNLSDYPCSLGFEFCISHVPSLLDLRTLHRLHTLSRTIDPECVEICKCVSDRIIHSSCCLHHLEEKTIDPCLVSDSLEDILHDLWVDLLHLAQLIAKHQFSHSIGYI